MVGLDVTLDVPELVADVLGVEVALLVPVVDGVVLTVELGVDVIVVVFELVPDVVGVDRLHDVNVPSVNDCIALFNTVTVSSHSLSTIR